jgi:hypothetical protein
MAFASREFTEQVRQRVDICDIIGRYTDMSRAKRTSGSFMVFSPFNEEKTPSCSVTTDKNMFNDFSSGKAGDAFKLVMLKENLTFPESVIFVGRIYNLEPSHDKVLTQETENIAALENFLGDARLAMLANKPRVGELLAKLGLPERWMDSFKIGYIPPATTRLVDDTPAASRLGLVPGASPRFASDALVMRLTDSKRRTIGLVAHDGKKLTSTSAHIGFSPGSYIFKIGTEGTPRLFTSPFESLAFLARNRNAAVASTLGFPLTLDAVARATGEKVSAGKSFADLRAEAKLAQDKGKAVAG